MTEYFLLLTMVAQVGGGQGFQTVSEVRQFPANVTRAELLKVAIGLVDSRMRRGNVVFFDAQPNRPATGRAS